MAFEHIKYGPGGRVYFDSATGKTRQVMQAGLRHIKKPDGSYVPYEWDQTKKILRFHEGLEIRLAGSGLEFWQYGAKVFTAAFHPEILIGGTWTRKLSGISGLTITQEEDDATSRFKVSYKVTTADGEAEVSLRAGGLPKVLFGYKITTTKNCTFRVRMDTDIAEAGEDVTYRSKDGLQTAKVGKQFGNGWKVGWFKEEEADHITEFDTTFKTRLKEGDYTKNIPKVLSPTSIGPYSIGANANDGEFYYYSSAWTFTNSSSDAYFGDNESHYYYAFFRFQITDEIPTDVASFDAGTQIDIYGTGIWQWDDGTDDIAVMATDGDNAAAPAAAGARPSEEGGSTTTTTAVVSWPNVTWATAGWNTSPSLAAIFSELHTSYDLADDDYVVLWVRGAQTGSDDQVGWQSLEHAGTNPAKLTIVYTAAGGASASVSETLNFAEALD